MRSSSMATTSGEKTLKEEDKIFLRGVVARAQQSPHALPGKAAVIGFSQGGAATLTWATQNAGIGFRGGNLLPGHSDPLIIQLPSSQK